jgi:hypothetical protein
MQPAAMRRALLALLALLVPFLAGCADDAPTADEDTVVPADGAGDAVVVAVIDGGFNPYHFDFLAAHMPQAQNADPSDDLPLDADPSTWLPGFPEPSSFASYGALRLNLTPDNDKADPTCTPVAASQVPPRAATECPYPGLYENDTAAWETVNRSTLQEVHFKYVPGTKVVGYVNFGSGTGFGAQTHGVGTTSVSVGNYHGSCAECLLVFVNGGSEDSIRWVLSQPWIDLVTNSYGAGSFQVAGLVRDNIYDDCDLQAQQTAVERGLQVFFSGGNGFANAFDAPPMTLASCQKGPDWIVTVGAITPDGENSYTGHGKPVDVAAPGSGYPSAGGADVNATVSFSGTSNAAPVTAGLYAAALADLRQALPGPSRMQVNGTVATGPAGCGTANAECAMADGFLTVHEVRQALYRAAQPTAGYFADPVTRSGIPVGNAETELWTEGHGSFMAHLGDLDGEVKRIVDYALGEWTEEPSAAETAWMTAYSYCAQQVWGTWKHGAWTEGSALPTPDPQWPYRTFMATDCPEIVEAVVLVATTVGPT